MQTISNKQYQLLKDFMLHCYHVIHNNNTNNYTFWAKLLDDNNIPWSVQNNAAYLMEDYNSKNYYSSTLLKSKNILITGVTV